MEKKQTVYKIKGMSRDLNNMSFDKEHSFENKNIRITADKDNGLLSITNEKGTKQIDLHGTISFLPINLITHSTKVLQSEYPVKTDIEVLCFVLNKQTNQSELHIFTILTGNSESQELEVEYDYEITNSQQPINGTNHYYYEDSFYCYQTKEDLISRDFDREYIPLGVAEVGEEIVLFLHNDNTEKDPDRIAVLFFNNDVLYFKIVYSGDLNFSVDHPIETLVDIETSTLKKVYWVDGLNPLRVINVFNSYLEDTSEDPFAFVQPIQFNHTLDVSRIDYGGSFPAGVIQYAFTYFNKFGQESAIVDTTPIYYIAYPDRGAAPNDIVSCSFQIDITNPDTNWEYVRIYSIIRTSLNTTPEVKKIVDLPIKEGIDITYTDTNSYGENVADTDLLFKDGEILSASTLAQKDGTLFLGDIETKSSTVPSEEIKELIRDYLAPGNSVEDSIGIKIGPTPLYDGGYNSEESTGGSIYDYFNTLSYNNSNNTTFKSGETYRLGVQLQDTYGRWSDPIHIEDLKITARPSEDPSLEGTVVKLVKIFTSFDNYLASALCKKGYINIRPLIVYPQENERTCVAQGILCPTVYNVEDRLNNQPFAQSSWFLRPNDLMVSNIPLINTEDSSDITSFNSSGKWAEFRHNHNIQLDYQNDNGEIADFGYRLEDNNIPDIQPEAYIHDGDDSITITDSYGNEVVINVPAASKSDFETTYKNNFYVDRNILTFHSPDINDNIKTEGLKLRIVGYVPITSSKSEIDITTSTSEILDKASLNHVKGLIKSYNKSTFAGRHVINGRYWYDYWYDSGNKCTTLYSIYPWNRSTGLSFTTGNVSPTLLKKSRYSIIQYSNNTVYTAYTNDINIEDTEVHLCNYNNPLVTFSDNTNYLGDYNKIISPESYSYGYGTCLLGMLDTEDTTVADQASTYDNYISSIKALTDGKLSTFQMEDLLVYGKGERLSQVSESKRDKISLIPISYKSSPHIVIKLKENKYLTEDINESTDEYTVRPFWKDTDITINDVGCLFDGGNTNGYSYLFLGELYREVDTDTLFGGTSEYAIQNNLWVPCGKTRNISSLGSDSSARLVWEEGDTYYQRYDHVKTKPYDDTSLNGVTVIASFMCETRTNLDGRYDRNRIQDDYFNITDENYNLVNPVYNQQNNYFNYRILDSERFGITKFPSSIVWSKTKLPNSIIDNWLNINLASTLDLDNNKGPVTSLRRFNNEIIAFQDKGLAQILYNTRTQISATDGVPIEIANSGKVDGKRYISDNIGCLNKYSICESPNGLYFIDDYNKSINIYNSNGLQSLSEAKGFHSWVINNSSNKAWNPIDFNNVITYRDPINSEILFVYKDTCLVYNELLEEFTSFYDYGKSYPFVSLNGRNFIFNDNVLYGYQEGEYGNIFGVNRDYYIDIIANENPLNDKIFTNVEFRGDTYNKDGSLLNDKIDFKTLTAITEYQNASHTLHYNKYKSSNLKKKFRIWRADIPRDGRDRIRNTWAHIKLQGNGNRKTRLHDLSVIYYV